MREPALEPARHPGATLTSVDGRTYPLESARVSARSEGGIAVTRLFQVYANPHDEPLEVVYTLPLPADGAVLGYTIRMGEKVIRGEVEPREKAEALYKEALYQGKTAGLLEQDRADTFRQRLGNLPPRTAAEIEIQVLHPLAFLPAAPGAEPKWEYRFPTVVGVRYEGAEGRVADAERLDVDRDGGGNIPTRVEFELAIAGWPGGEARVESLNHDLRVETADGTATAVLMHAARLDRDFVVRWAACAEEVGVRLTVGGGLPGDDGCYGLLTVTPPAAPSASFARDLTVLIDASGSMSGQPIATAKRLVAEVLRGLERVDRFEIIEFSHTPRRLTRGMKAASDAEVEEAISTVARIRAAGATEMSAAMLEALEPLRPDAQRQVVLVTDGDIGFESEVQQIVRDGLPAGARLHCVGIGSAPNRTLTHGLARAGRGTEMFAHDVDSAVEAARRLGAATARPVLTEISVKGDVVRRLAPERPRDVFAGQPLVMAVELDPRGGALEVRGRLAGAGEAWVQRLQVPAGGAVEALGSFSASPLPIGALYGREAIADAETALLGRDARAMRAKIERLGLRHRIASSETSLVAVADEPGVDPTAPRRRERLAIEVPMGVSAAGAGLVGGSYDRACRFGMPLAADLSHARSLSSIFSQVKLIGGPSVIDHVCVIDPVSVVEIDERILVLEFEAPLDGFQIPVRDVLATVDGKALGEAAVMTARSTRPGPFAAKLLVKLALEHPGGKRWKPGQSIDLNWEDYVEDADGATQRMLFALRVVIPASGPRDSRP